MKGGGRGEGRGGRGGGELINAKTYCLFIYRRSYIKLNIEREKALDQCQVNFLDVHLNSLDVHLLSSLLGQP